MAALMGAVDAMLKTAVVRVCGRHGIGSGWVTVTVEGEVAAVQAAVQAGRPAAERWGELIVAEVIPRPDAGAMAAMPHRAGLPVSEVGRQALGMLEVQGLAPLIAGADAMVKTAAVTLAGWAFIGGALTHLIVRGDVASVETAVAAGRRAAEGVGEVHATLVIPNPEAGIGPLFPPGISGDVAPAGALGVLETTGYVGVVVGGDAILKAASVEILQLRIGSGGRIAALVRGALDAVQAAIEAGADAARAAGELNSACVISRPDALVMACFGGDAPEMGAPESVGNAMGLIETRSTVALVKAMDQMLKSAEVAYGGSYKVGYFLTASVIRGDVGAVQAALAVGAAEAEKYGELVATHLIPHPLPDLEARLPHGSFEHNER